MKKFRIRVIIIFYCPCFLWLIMSLFGCNQTSKNIISENSMIYGDVTLLWNEISSANSYNVYMAQSPGVAKLTGHKISNVEPPVRINQLEPDKSYYFVVTVVNNSGESKESKELSYYPVANKIGLVYWKNFFDNSKHGHKYKTTKNEALIDAISDDKKPSDDLAKKNLHPSKKGMAKNIVFQEDITENSKSTIAADLSYNTDHNLLELDEMRLKAAQMNVDSHYYIFFDKYSNELSTKAIEKLNKVYKILINNPEAKLTLNGYSDSSGASSVNQMLSEVRASSVKSYLSGKGINPSRIMAFGHGAKNFLVSNNSAEGRHLNRRVEIKLIIPLNRLFHESAFFP